MFSTKNRRPFLGDDIRTDLHAYLAGILANHESPARLIGSVDDHVHVLFALSKNRPLAGVVQELKQSSSKRLKGVSAKLADFHWQSGYAAFSVSESKLELVERYVANQKEHHAKVTFQDELRRILSRHGLAFDERYLWD